MLFAPEKKNSSNCLSRKSPVKIEANVNIRKRLNTDSEVYMISKNAKVTPTEMEFPYSETST